MKKSPWYCYSCRVMHASNARRLLYKDNKYICERKAYEMLCKGDKYICERKASEPAVK